MSTQLLETNRSLLIGHSFPEQIAPLAVAVVQRLLQTFTELIGPGHDDDENGESAFLAAQTLSTIVCVFDATQHNLEALQQLEGMVVPLLGQLLTEEFGDGFEYIGMKLNSSIQSMQYYPDTLFGRILHRCIY